MLDISSVQCVLPSFVMPLLIGLNTINEEIELVCSQELKDILFPCGLVAQELRPVQLKAVLNDYSNRGRFPIFDFPASSSSEDETSSIIGCLESAIYANLKTPNNIINGLRYVIGEIIDNVTQHSKSNKGYIYPYINHDEGFIEVSIADCGIGLLGSYNANNDKDICSDIEAIQAANRGISTKNLPNAENRGFGIVTSKRMIIEGLKGAYIMMSGNALSLKGSSVTQFLQLAPKMRFDGTIVIFRMPLMANGFNYINYIE